MARKYPARYVAAGFHDDANQLLKHFTAQKSLKFSCFACVWRDYRFSSIFMGRETRRELTEFIEECYRNSLMFLDDSNPFMKVGAVYLLYSLYLKQPSHLLLRSVQILVSIRQLQEIYQLEYHFMEKRTMDALHFSFIIAKLFKMEAFRISCFPIPMGPAVPTIFFKVAPLRNSCFKEALGALCMLNDQGLENIRETAKEFETLRKALSHHVCVYDTEALNKLGDLEKYIFQLEECYNAGVTLTEEDDSIKQKVENMNLGQRNALSIGQHSQKTEDAKPPPDLGQRRVLLKAQQFGRPAEVKLHPDLGERNALSIGHHSQRTEEVKPPPDLGQRNALSVGQQSQRTEEIKSPPGLGQRRALLKAQQFVRAAEGLFTKTCQTTDFSSEKSPLSTPVKKEQGKPKIGRGKKKKAGVQRKLKFNIAHQEKEFDVHDKISDKILNSSTRTKKIRKPYPARRHYFEDEDY